MKYKTFKYINQKEKSTTVPKKVAALAQGKQIHGNEGIIT